MKFQKGNKINIGRKHTLEARKNMRLSHVGKSLSVETREKLSKALKNPSSETRKKMSEAQKGEKNTMFGKRFCGKNNPFYGKTHTKESKEKNRNAHVGKKHTAETRKKLSNVKKRGSQHHNWKGGVTPKNIKIRMSLEYKLWRTAVFERDKYTCIWCGQVGVELNADHILPFADYPEHRFSIDNGRTLCKSCHIKRHKKN